LIIFIEDLQPITNRASASCNQHAVSASSYIDKQVMFAWATICSRNFGVLTQCANSLQYSNSELNTMYHHCACQELINITLTVCYARVHTLCGYRANTILDIRFGYQRKYKIRLNI